MRKEMDPAVVASNVFKVLNENDKVRVLDVVSKPGDVAKMHSHPDHVVYVVTGGRASFTSGDKTQEMELKTGSVNFFDAQENEMKNIGNTNSDGTEKVKLPLWAVFF